LFTVVTVYCNTSRAQTCPAFSRRRTSIVFSAYGHHRDLHSFLHDALPIYQAAGERAQRPGVPGNAEGGARGEEAGTKGVAGGAGDRKSTRLNSSHVKISYAVFCLQKKKRAQTWSTQLTFSSQ